MLRRGRQGVLGVEHSDWLTSLWLFPAFRRAARRRQSDYLRYYDGRCAVDIEYFSILGSEPTGREPTTQNQRLCDLPERQSDARYARGWQSRDLSRWQ